MKLNYFNFKKFDDRVLLTNDFGKYAFVTNSEFKSIISKQVDLSSDLGKKLLENKMVYDEPDLGYSAINKYDLREIKGHVSTSTSLHIFVVTTVCNMACVYCQANNGSECSNLYMDEETAEKAVDIALESPTRDLSFEFQGGEPLINYKIIKHIVEYAEAKKGNHCISYNIVTNLTLLEDEMIDFFKEYKFGVSTSLDGPINVHDKNRVYVNGKGTFEKVMDSVKRLREAGIEVGAIETTTKESLKYPREIVRAYAENGFHTIFLRPLTPLGKATVNWDEIGYTPEEFIDFYQTATNELLNINREGYFIKEDHATILLKRIDGQFMNYMELRSPCGAGIGQLAYYADGNIFTCDEGRMIYEMGQDTFKLGNVFENTYNDIIQSGVCKTVCKSSILESIPSCCDCVYQPYCGTCPVVNFAAYEDVIEKQPRGYRCKIYSGILDYLFGKFLENNIEVTNILKKWGN